MYYSGNIGVSLHKLQKDCIGHISYIQLESPDIDSKAILMEDLAQAAIDAALTTGASFADVRIENSTTTIIELNLRRFEISGKINHTFPLLDLYTKISMFLLIFVHIHAIFASIELI